MAVVTPVRPKLDPAKLDPAKLDLATRAIQLGQVVRAEALLREIIDERPSNVEAVGQLGRLLLGLGRPEEAERLFGRVIRSRPRSDAAHDGRGVALTQLGRLNEALASFDRAVARNPSDAGYWNNRGLALAALGRWADAVRSYEKSLVQGLDAPGTHNNLGIALDRLKRYAEALDSYDRAIRLDPRPVDALVNRGQTLIHMTRFADALDSHDRAIALDPNNPNAHQARGLALEGLCRYADATAAYHVAIALDPRHVDALTGRANVSYNQGHFEEALKDYAAAIAVDPSHGPARAFESMCRLATGDYAQGWKNYESRWQAGLDIGKADLPGRPWLGDFPIDGKTILVRPEQGLGDSLQFCRYVPMLAARAAVIVEAPRSLSRLFGGLKGVSRIVLPRDRLPHVDARVSMMSLPLAFGTTVATIPSAVPYLYADPEQSAAWRKRLAPLPGRKIGLVWAGSPRPEDPNAHAVDQRRSMTLQHFAPLAMVPGLCLISLQKGLPAAQARTPPAGMVLHDWTEELDDFADTAALIEALDLVISVDTSVVHLAGALGKPVWVLNRYDLCWRWLRGRTDSPWYPTARLFHQRSPGDWSGVIQDIAAALSAQDITAALSAQDITTALSAQDITAALSAAEQEKSPCP